MKEYIYLSIMLICAMSLGWFVNEIYDDKVNHRDYDGLWMSGNLSKIEAMETAREHDSVGNWICVNIKGMDMDRMQETVMHEVAHEAFARYCSKNITKCLEVVK